MVTSLLPREVTSLNNFYMLWFLEDLGLNGLGTRVVCSQLWAFGPVL